MLNQLIAQLYQHANPQEAPKMASYMKNQFGFLGIRTPERTLLCQKFFQHAKKNRQVDWQVVMQLWNLPEREFQYIACDYLRLLQSHLTVQDLPKLKELAQTKSWWDTIDNLDRTIGNIEFPSEILNQTMLKWSKDNNIWLRRIAIDHQLLRKNKTNTVLLERILLNNLEHGEFFINKAMGWALRDYSKTNPDWVREFVEKYRESLSSLTLKEANKYL